MSVFDFTFVCESDSHRPPLLAMRFLLPASLLLLTGIATAQNAGQPITSENNQRLRDGLRQFPEADTNKDGILTLEEGRAFLAKMKQSAGAPESDGKKTKAAGITPTFADVAYGAHERNKLDFWQARSSAPTPVVVFIHGGGFVAGDKSSWRNSPLLTQLLEKGVSCAAINYPYRTSVPVQDILRHSARAVQFIRSKSGEWNLDKNRIAAQGGSAGAGTSLWLATRDDLADPAAADPVLRESSRVCACVLMATQATYDITRWESFLGPAKPEWQRNPNDGALFYGLQKLSDLETPAGKKALAECDMLAWISKDDGPVLCSVNQPDGPIKDRGHWLHHPKHAEEIKKFCDACAVSCTILRADKQAAGNPTLEFLLAQLKPARASSSSE